MIIKAPIPSSWPLFSHCMLYTLQPLLRPYVRHAFLDVAVFRKTRGGISGIHTMSRPRGKLGMRNGMLSQPYGVGKRSRCHWPFAVPGLMDCIELLLVLGYWLPDLQLASLSLDQAYETAAP